MHIVEVFGRILLSALFLIEGVRNRDQIAFKSFKYMQEKTKNLSLFITILTNFFMKRLMRFII